VLHGWRPDLTQDRVSNPVNLFFPVIYIAPYVQVLCTRIECCFGIGTNAKGACVRRKVASIRVAEVIIFYLGSGSLVFSYAAAGR